MSLRWKIAVVLAMLAALATTAVGVASYRSTRDRLYDEVDRSLDNPAFTFDDGFSGDDEFDVPAGPRPRHLDIPALIEIQWIDRHEVHAITIDRPIAPSEEALRLVGRPGRSHTQTVSADGTDYRVRTIGQPNGAIQLARPLDEVNRVLASLQARTFGVVILVTGVAALAGWLIAGQVTARLRRLTVAADSVRATGRLDIHVPEGGDDEVGRLGSAFDDMLGALARSRAEQQRLVQDAGHELKTPLTSIRTNLDVLRRHRALTADDRAQIVDDLHGEVEEMVDLVEEIVAVAAGVASDESPSTFSLGDVATETSTRAARRTGRTITVEADESTVYAQPAAVQRAIANLLDNAVKFDSSGEPIEVHVDGGRVDVLDRGPGIADADLPLVFERFHRADDVQSLPGSGLGLAIVRDVVARNGGTVHAANRDGGGAVVGFTLPLALQPPN